MLRTFCVVWLLGMAAAPGLRAQEAEPELEPEVEDAGSVARLLLDDVATQTEPEPTVELYFRALGRDGLPVSGLRSSDLEVWQDTERIPEEDVSLQAMRASGSRIAGVVAIDASGSMKGEAFAHAKEAALTLLELLDPQDPVAVVTFGDEVTEVVQFGEPRAQARKSLRDLELDLAKGQHTHLLDGAHRAIELIRTTPALPRRSFVIVLSDGEDDGSAHGADEVIALAKGVEDDPPILLYAIGYVGRTRAESAVALQDLAERAGGDFQRADSAGHLQDFFDAIARQVLSSYVVRFPGDLDGERHLLRLVLHGKTSEREALYPDLGGSLWPMVGALAAAMVLVGIGVLVYLLRAGASVGRLEVVSGPAAGTVLKLHAGKTRIGACDDNDLVIDSSTISRYHAEIIAQGRKVEIEDLHSTNGTFVNGGAVQRRQPLRPGDRIAIADVELRFER
jgi:Mg-chelatase subunit ChlD